jgi:hypothetical protein
LIPYLSIFIRSGEKRASHVRFALKQPGFDGVSAEEPVSLGEVLESD